MNQCSSYRFGLGICKDGFFQRYSCWQSSATGVPNCCLDELPKHYVNDDGSPRFYVPAVTGKSG